MENHKSHQSQGSAHQPKSATNHYKMLLAMVVLSYAAMYALMYSMVNSFANVVPNINQFYMAGLMAMPMVIIEIVLMWAMYENIKLNLLLIGISAVAMLAFFFFIRQQTAVGDKQFLKSMIPHHAGAILMCQQADLQDPEIKELCKTIIVSQQAEIDRMKAKLEALNK